MLILIFDVNCKHLFCRYSVMHNILIYFQLFNTEGTEKWKLFTLYSLAPIIYIVLTKFNMLIKINFNIENWKHVRIICIKRRYLKIKRNNKNIHHWKTKIIISRLIKIWVLQKTIRIRCLFDLNKCVTF